MNMQLPDRAQLYAIRHRNGPLLVSAGPGSGKTTVIISHVNFLIHELQIDPGSILVVTFTKAAALEMKERFLAMSASSTAEASAASPRFGTMHSVFFEILKTSAPQISISFINDIDRDAYLKSLMQQYSTQGGDMEDMDGIEPDLIARLAAHLSKIVNTSGTSSSSPALSFPGLSNDSVMNILRQYQSFKRRHGLMDFDDILVEAWRLLNRDHDTAVYWQQKYRYILIDEFQDINELQYRCMHILEAPWNNIYAVGDEDQSIYGFRGSFPGIFRRFLADHPGCETVRLQQNYRACDRVLDPARNLICHNRHRIEKAMTGRSGPAEAAFHLMCCKDQWEEYRRIAQTVRICQQKGIPPDRQVILLRSFQHLPDILLCMQHCGLRVQVIGADHSKSSVTDGLLSHFITKDMIACFQLARQPETLLQVIHSRLIQKDHDHRVLASAAAHSLSTSHLDHVPQSHAGDPELSALFRYLHQIRPMFLPHVSRYSLTKEHPLPIDPQGQQELKKLQKHLTFLAKLSPYPAFEYMLRAMGYERYLRSLARHSHSDMVPFEDTLQRLKDCLRQFQTKEHVIEFILTGNNENARSIAGSPDCLQIRTMHSSKGLEYEAVYIPDLNKGIIPDSRAVGDAIEEERRLLYVAMTRAKLFLHLYYVERIRGKPVFPSLFINELAKGSC